MTATGAICPDRREIVSRKTSAPGGVPAWPGHRCKGREAAKGEPRGLRHV